MEKGSGIRFVTLVITSLLLSGAFFAFALSTVTGAQDGDYTYTVVGGVATIDSYTGAGGVIAIPSTLGGFATAAIGNEAFNNPHGYLVTSVSIPNSVKTVDNYAFANCQMLYTATIGKGVMSMGDEVFYSCNSLLSIAVDPANTYFTSISGVLYNESLTTLIKCPSGKTGSVVIPDSVTSFDWDAFQSCKWIDQLSIGKGITSINPYTFEECTSLISVTFSPSSNLTSIGDRAFDSCPSLVTVSLPDHLKTIGYKAFQFCKMLTPLNIPGNVTSIDDEAFRACTSLTNVSIPASVESLGRNVFAECFNITSINVDGGNKNYTSMGGVLYNKNATTLIQYPPGRNGSFTVPVGVTAIDYGAFAGCSKLTSVLTGSSVTTVGQIAFAACPKLTSVILDGSVNAIGFMAFAGCTNLTSITISANMTNISSYTFYGCTSLTSISFFGMVSPADVGELWIMNVPSSCRGHAFPASNFPVPGSTYYGLTMGSNLAPMVPGAPTNISAGSGNGLAVLAWATPNVNGGSFITGYRVYRSASESGTYSLIASPTGPNHSDIGLNNGQTYWYEISAVNAAGEGPRTVAISVTPSTIPDVPSGVTATPSNGNVTLNWAPPANTGGCEITGYEIYRSANESGIYSLIASVSGTSFTDSNVSSGQTYWYKVRAVNGLGEGAQSLSTSAVLSSQTTNDNAVLIMVAVAAIGALLVASIIAVFRWKGRTR